MPRIELFVVAGRAAGQRALATLAHAAHGGVGALGTLGTLAPCLARGPRGLADARHEERGGLRGARLEAQRVCQPAGPASRKPRAHPSPWCVRLLRRPRAETTGGLPLAPAGRRCGVCGRRRGAGHSAGGGVGGRGIEEAGSEPSCRAGLGRRGVRAQVGARPAARLAGRRPPRPRSAYSKYMVTSTSSF